MPKYEVRTWYGGEWVVGHEEGFGGISSFRITNYWPMKPDAQAECDRLNNLEPAVVSDPAVLIGPATPATNSERESESKQARSSSEEATAIAPKPKQIFALMLATELEEVLRDLYTEGTTVKYLPEGLLPWAGTLSMAHRCAIDLVKEISALEAALSRIEEAESVKKEIVALLKEIQWVPITKDVTRKTWCAACSSWCHEGHAPDCKLAAMIAKLEDK